MNLPHILVVDDEPINLAIIKEYLKNIDAKLSFANDGGEAWALLEANPDDFDIILLDRMMPIMTGMEVLDKISNHPTLKKCPVIMQTAMASNSEISEGISAGAYYYLTKPFEADMLRSIVNAAISDQKNNQLLQVELDSISRPIAKMYQAEFGFKTLQEARDLATLIAKVCHDSKKIIMGLSEFLINAVEHGNLEITYNEKTILNNEARWEQEVENRLQNDKYKSREALLKFSHNDLGYHITIKDEGAGFIWDNYLEMSPDRATDNHGRGIALAASLGFDKIEYRGCGNEVYLFIAAKRNILVRAISL